MKCFRQRHSAGRWFWLCTALFLWSCLPVTVLCQERLLQDTPSPGLSADQIIDFAEHLMLEQEYFRAITEYHRFLFLHSQDPRVPMIHFRIGLALYRGQSYAEASRVFSEVAGRYPDTVYGQQAWLWWGESLARQGLYREAEQFYTELHTRFPKHLIGQQALYNKGWILLYRRQWREASSHFGQISPTSPLHASAQELAHEALKGANLARQSPLVAGILSGLLPGSGQLYNGRTGDALLAFFLNGLFLVGIVEAIQHKALTVAGMLSFFEAGWYVGNVYGAVNGAYKANQNSTRHFLQNLENRYPSTILETPRSPLMGVKFSLGF